MKIKYITLAFLVFILVGHAIFAKVLVRQEHAASKNEIYNKGNHVVSLIALHSIRDFEGRRRDFFVKTLTEYAFTQGLAYCFINDKDGKPVVALTFDTVGAEIPYQIPSSILAAAGLGNPVSKAGGTGYSMYEFAKPIYENGEKTGTVRIGFKPPSITMISKEKISLIGMLSFFIISAVAFVYFAFVKAFKPVEQFLGKVLNDKDGSASGLSTSSKELGIAKVMKNFKTSIKELKDRLDEIETKNKEFATRVGVLRFEKNQALYILNSVDFGIVITDIQDNVGYINDYMLRLIDKSRQEVIDSPLEKVFTNKEITGFISKQEGVKKLRANSHLDISFPDLAPGETYRVFCSYLLDDNNALIGKMILFTNTTKEKEAADATLAFTAHLSHELMTPLTTIKSYSEMLVDGEVKDGETQKEFYNTINSETTRLSDLIKDLLNLSKIEMGSLTLNQGRVNSDLLFSDCITTVKGAARVKNISLQQNLPDNSPTLIGDKELLKGALINILGNAVKYTPENGKIQFSLNEESNLVIFDINDSGYGMSKEELPRIFDKFYRSDNPQIAEQQGTGLGLTIASQIISLHGGKIEVQSNLGQGSHFSVKIPKKENYLGGE
jgi:signal transduction histidine kinase